MAVETVCCEIVSPMFPDPGKNTGKINLSVHPLDSFTLQLYVLQQHSTMRQKNVGTEQGIIRELVNADKTRACIRAPVQGG
jgi:hypothetical protein